MKKKKIFFTLSSLSVLILGTSGTVSNIGLSLAVQSDKPTTNLTDVKLLNDSTQPREETKPEVKEVTNRIFIGKDSAIPIAGNGPDKQIIAKITDTNGKFIKNITSVDGQNYVDIKLPLDDYYVEITKGLENPTYLNPMANLKVVLSPASGTEPYDAPEKYPRVNLLYEPVILKDDHVANRQFKLNDVVLDYTIKDVIGHGFTFMRNWTSNKMTFLIFVDTADSYTMDMLTDLQNLITENKWENKVNIFCISATDSMDKLINLQQTTYSKFRWVYDENRSFQKHFFFPNQSVPAIALVDFQGCVDALEYGTKNNVWFETMIKKFSLPKFLDFDFDADYKADLGDGKDNLPSTGLPKSLADLMKIKASEIAKVEKYNSNDYNLIDDRYLPVKPEEYIPEAVNITSYISLERSGVPYQDLAREALSKNFFNRNLKNDVWLLNPLDVWNKTEQTKQLELSDAINLYSEWLGPITVADYSMDKYALAHNFQLKGFSLKHFFSYATPDQRINAIKELVARYGAIAVTFNDTKVDYFTNVNSQNNKGFSYSTIICGWDDTVDQSKFTPAATRKGAFICKNTTEELKTRKFFNLSYDSPLVDAITFELIPNRFAEFNNNYYYDSDPLSDANIDNNVVSDQAAAVFPVKVADNIYNEQLEAVSVGVLGDDVTVDVSIYRGINKVDFVDPKKDLDPTNGEFLINAKGYAKYSGNVVVLLPYPIDIKKHENFSVVVKVSNPRNDAKIVYGTDRSVDNMTYYNKNGNWVNAMSLKPYAAARIKALTNSFKKNIIEFSNNLEDSTIMLNKYSWRYKSNEFRPIPSVYLNTKLLLNKTGYNFNNNQYILKPQDSYTSNDAVIGQGQVNVEGVSPITGKQTVYYWIYVGIAPDLGDIGSYANFTSDNVPKTINIRINNSAKYIKDIILPYGFEWQNVDENALIDHTEIGKGSLVYAADDAKCFRANQWPGSNVALTRLETDSIVRPSKPTEPDTNPDVPVAPGPGDSDTGIPYFPTSAPRTDYVEIIALVVIILVVISLIALIWVLIHIKRNKRY